MKTIQKVGLFVALCLLGLIGLFPPVTSAGHGDGGFRNRAFLLTYDGTTYFPDPSGSEIVGIPGGQLNGGRLLAEALVICSLVGLMTFLLSLMPALFPEPPRPPSASPPGTAQAADRVEKAGR